MFGRKSTLARPKKELVIDSSVSIDNSKSILESVANTLQHIISQTGKIDRKTVSMLVDAVDMLLKISREERERAERYKDVSTADLIKLSKKAVKVLKKSLA